MNPIRNKLEWNDSPRWSVCNAARLNFGTPVLGRMFVGMWAPSALNPEDASGSIHVIENGGDFRNSGRSAWRGQPLASIDRQHRPYW